MLKTFKLKQKIEFYPKQGKVVVSVVQRTLSGLVMLHDVN